MSKRTILDEAAEVVSGGRQEDYGHPAKNHGCTAEMWSAYLLRRFGVRLVLTPEDVCMLNILQKVSRCANTLTRDSVVDIAGYAANIELVRELGP